MNNEFSIPTHDPTLEDVVTNISQKVNVRTFRLGH